jgi:D-alanine-D-alanine ligase
MSKRLKVGVLFGGRSAEHEVSLRSAAAVIAALDRGKYDVIPIKIGRDGSWQLPAAREHAFLEGVAGSESRSTGLLADPTASRLLVKETRDSDAPASRSTWGPQPGLGKLDVVFPVLHGTYGEDGTVQGFLELTGIPYVGAGVAASAVSMDKALMKSLFRERGLPVLRWKVVLRHEWERASNQVVSDIEASLSYPIFVKPANMGSSVGVSKVSKREDIAPALREAFRYDRKALVEQGADAREIEVSVLGNDEPRASLPGEIVPAREFYDYQAKYVYDDSELLIPASLDEQMTGRAQELAVEAFRAVDAAGMARVDLFLVRSSGELVINEINTIPGFTSISMYPKLWEASGVPMAELVDRLIELALERASEKARQETTYLPPEP